MNEMKQNKIWSRLKGWVQKIFQTLLPNFGMCHNEFLMKKILFIFHGMDDSERYTANIYQKILSCFKIILS
jgi:hypothetical protein